ncbi:hypothetical protein HMN09_00858000 [Mycena chlorophos]|uniref:Uncharacterized protein n=1 Tax=Mycena chlorophos TaxID=658473 RepID=A0A8H6SSQ2_MYCCL|nr:hypothetical protein HMN09_00858000 [Mycena chlorophos]
MRQTQQLRTLCGGRCVFARFVCVPSLSRQLIQCHRFGRPGAIAFPSSSDVALPAASVSTRDTPRMTMGPVQAAGERGLRPAHTGHDTTRKLRGLTTMGPGTVEDRFRYAQRPTIRHRRLLPPDGYPLLGPPAVIPSPASGETLTRTAVFRNRWLALRYECWSEVTF